MSEVPSAGWREVYRACHVPMTLQQEVPIEKQEDDVNTSTRSTEQAVENGVKGDRKVGTRDVRLCD